MESIRPQKHAQILKDQNFFCWVKQIILNYNLTN